MDQVVTRTKFDKWLKSEFEPVQHQAMVAVPRIEEFVHHMEEVERQLSRSPSGSRDVRPSSATATGDEVMTQESLLRAKHTSRESTLEIGTPASAKRRHQAPPVTPSNTPGADVFGHMLSEPARKFKDKAGTRLDMWKHLAPTSESA